jgi:hypothetical protein
MGCLLRENREFTLFLFSRLGRSILGIKISPERLKRKEKKMRYVSIALVLLLGLAMGCATTYEGKKIDGSKTKGLVAEGTTPDDVVRMFGHPQQKENLPSGETKYIYYYRMKKPFAFGTDPQELQRLEVFIKNNQVDRYRFVDRDVEPITTDVPPLQPSR